MAQSLVELARKLRPYIEKAAEFLDDEDSLEAIQLFPNWDESATYEVGIKVKYGEFLYKCLQAHSAQAGWNPTEAPSLWAKVLIPDPTVIPEWEQPDSTNPYMKGDKVRYFNKIYESLIDNNIWAPDLYPAGWKEIQV